MRAAAGRKPVDVLGVVPVGQLAVDVTQLQGHDGQAFGLEPARDRADQTAAYGVGLQQHERPLGRRGRGGRFAG